MTFVITKARRRPRFVDRQPRSEPFRAMHLAANPRIPVVRRAFERALRRFRRAISVDDISMILARHGPEIAAQLLPWEVMRHSFETDALDALKDTFRAGARAGERTTGLKPVQKQERTFDLVGVFDAANPRAVRQAALLAADLVTRADAETRAAIREIIVLAQQGGLSRLTQAREIVRILRRGAGLTVRDARALANFERGLRETDIAERLIRQRVRIKRDRMLTRRAELIARQETMMAAHAGQHELWLQAVERGLIESTQLRTWITAPDRRICPICEPMEGQQVGLNEEFVSPFNGRRAKHPPMHIACLPGDAYVTPGGRIIAASKRWIDGDLVVIDCPGDLPLACTPNHPILTRRGWAPASGLNVGDEIGNSGLGEWVTAQNGQYVHRPARIEDIATAFLKHPAVVSAPQPMTSEDFHGDGVDGEIAVVGADRLLLYGLQAMRAQVISQQFFVHRYVCLAAFAGLRNSRLLFDAPDPTDGCSMCGRDLMRSLPLSHPRPFQVFSFGLSADTCTSFDEDPSNRSSANAEALSDLVLGDAAQIHPNDLMFREIQSLGHRKYSGLVYNIETTDGMYLANGTITHNCRCAVALVVEEP